MGIKGFSVTIGPIQPPCHAVDLDKTLAIYEHGDFQKLGPLAIGAPIAAMVDRVKAWRKKGEGVVIFTARLADPAADDPMMKMQILMAIQAWCRKNLGEVLEVTATKYPKLTDFWDDRNVCIEPNTGKLLLDPQADAQEKHGA